MSDYLTRLISRAAPRPLGDESRADRVHPEHALIWRGTDDPFDATVVDPLDWPASPQPHLQVPRIDVSAPPREARGLPGPEPRADAPLHAPVRNTPAPPILPFEPPSIAETLRPAPSPPEPRSPAPDADRSERMDVKYAHDPLNVADRFMSRVLPSALLPPPTPSETVREVIRETTEVRTLQPAAEMPSITPPSPAAANAESEPPAVSGLVIGRLSVTVVPPASVPPPVGAAPVPSSPRIVVAGSTGASSPGVPSFSRFG